MWVGWGGVGWGGVGGRLRGEEGSRNGRQGRREEGKEARLVSLSFGVEFFFFFSANHRSLSTRVSPHFLYQARSVLCAETASRKRSSERARFALETRGRKTRGSSLSNQHGLFRGNFAHCAPLFPCPLIQTNLVLAAPHHGLGELELVAGHVQGLPRGLLDRGDGEGVHFVWGVFFHFPSEVKRKNGSLTHSLVKKKKKKK